MRRDVPRSRLRPYQIKATIGAGAMGEVHQARADSLERDVAMKVRVALPFGALTGNYTPRGVGQRLRDVSVRRRSADTSVRTAPALSRQ